MVSFSEMSDGARWNLMVGAARRAAEENGFVVKRLPGRGLSNTVVMEKDGRSQVTSIRTTRDRWIAYQPVEGGKDWKTLGDVESVLVATVDSKDNPRNVEVYLFGAADVRKRFDAAYKARTAAGQVVRDGFGMWVSLARDHRGIPASAGSGILDNYRPIGSYTLDHLMHMMAPPTEAEVAEMPPEEASTPVGRDDEPPLTIAEAKRRLAKTFGVSESDIKITVEG